jgi:DNA-binding transcriptional MocR family regulator
MATRSRRCGSGARQIAAAIPSTTSLTSSRPSASEPGPSVSPASRMAAQGRAQAIAAGLERRIRGGELGAGERLPTVRALAADLNVDPGTAAAAYRLLRERAFVISDGRRGTRVAAQLEPRQPSVSDVPPGVRDLASGIIDPVLVPEVGRALRHVAARRPDTTRYEENARLDALVAYARAEFAHAGIDAQALGFVGGALDGLERVLQAQLRPGDRVGVEDPAFPRLLDLLEALNLQIVPIAIDDEGPIPEELERARGLDALIVTPHGQNPFGASLSEERAAALRGLLGELLVIEDAHGWEVGHRPATLTAGRPHWAVIRSLSRLLGSDVRLAFVAGDEQTIGRVEARQAITTSWVSRLLQEILSELLVDLPGSSGELDRRRDALLAALDRRGIPAHGRSGLHVWVPVREKGFAVRRMFDAGYAVLAGERFRLRTPPAVRLTTALLPAAEVDPVADALAEAATGRSLIS